MMATSSAIRSMMNKYKSQMEFFGFKGEGDELGMYLVFDSIRELFRSFKHFKIVVLDSYSFFVV